MQQQGGPMGLVSISPRESLLPLELEEALEQRCPVEMEYLDGCDHRTIRRIQPLSVRRRNGELMLVAHCFLRNDRRHFKLDRIVQLVRVESPTAPAVVGQPSLFAEQSASESPAPLRIIPDRDPLIDQTQPDAPRPALGAADAAADRVAAVDPGSL
jgi:predicted DNA-binding transcriptional regulator YafY